MNKAPFKFDGWYWWGYASDYSDLENQPSQGFVSSPKPYASCRVCKLKWSECKCKRYKPNLKE